MTKREKSYHYRKRLSKEGNHFFTIKKVHGEPTWFYPKEQFIALKKRLSSINKDFPFFQKIYNG